MDNGIYTISERKQRPTFRRHTKEKESLPWRDHAHIVAVIIKEIS